ncbi:hypothetical protein FQN52_006281, partial [Onygenales sp. PD_12]
KLLDYSEGKAILKTLLPAYGNVESKAAIMGFIHRKHAIVKGEGYFADDPRATQVDSGNAFHGPNRGSVAREVGDTAQGNGHL